MNTAGHTTTTGSGHPTGDRVPVHLEVFTYEWHPEHPGDPAHGIFVSRHRDLVYVPHVTPAAVSEVLRARAPGLARPNRWVMLAAVGHRTEDNRAVVDLQVVPPRPEPSP